MNAAVSVHRARLSKLPSVPTAEREQIVREAEDSEQLTRDREAAKTAAESAHSLAIEELSRLKEAHLRLDASAEAARRGVADQEHRVQEAHQRLEHARGEIPSAWLSHSACQDEKALQALKEERDSLLESEDRAHELSEARERKSWLKGKISALHQQLDSIPHEHRRPVDLIQGELETIKGEITQTAARLREADDRLLDLLRQRSAVEGKQAELDEAEKELYYLNRLAEALGKGGLEAVIVRKAQEEIRQRANETLTSLSGGGLEIDLVDKADSEELQIQPRDLRTGGLRLFEYLSGGEKFRVAISLAVAIGQTVGGGRAAETLIIDEGFGALDEINRGLLVQELSRVSSVILRGGRVIVVSHQDDVCDDFTHCYRIMKDGSGYVSIARGVID